MSFKRQLLIKLVGMGLIVLLFNPVTAALTSNEIFFINEQPLVPQLKDVTYDGPSISSRDSYNVEHYETIEMEELDTRLRKRILLAIDYRDRGDTEQFSEILLDVITQNHVSEESAQAAILLGDFEVSLYNLDEAFKYYLYSANIHYASGFGISARFKLGALLDRMGHFSKAEEVLIDIVEREDESNPSVIDVKVYLKERYIERARWYLNSGDAVNAEKYFREYKLYEDVKVPETTK